MRLLGWAREGLRRYAAYPWWIRIWPPLIGAGMLWYLSSRPGTGKTSSVAWTFVHNSGHVVVYAVLGAAVLLALPAQTRQRQCGLALALTSLYGIVDEWHQSHVPGRHASIADALSDGIGAAIAVSAMAWILWRSERGLAALPWLLGAAVLAVASATWLPW